MKKVFFSFTVVLLLIPAIATAWQLPGKDIMQKIGIPGQQENKADNPAISVPAAGSTAAPAAVTEETPKSQTPTLTPDQADARACTAFVHEDFKKVNQALETTTLKKGVSRFISKKEWVAYLNDRYPNLKRDKNDFYIRYGKWFGKSCAYITLTCVPKDPGCTAEMRCMDLYTQKGGTTCPTNICEYNDKKCIEPYKSPAAK